MYEDVLSIALYGESKISSGFLIFSIVFAITTDAVRSCFIIYKVLHLPKMMQK